MFKEINEGDWNHHIKQFKNKNYNYFFHTVVLICFIAVTIMLFSFLYRFRSYFRSVYVIPCLFE